LFQNVTIEDVQRVARTYFTPESRVLLTINPGRAPGLPAVATSAKVGGLQ
jgi:predicted Zn-dependent peptidase